MKKIINLLLAMLVVVITQAQQNIPNGDFEDWGVHVTETLDNWEVTGNVAASSESVSGKKSLRLENKISDKSRGYISTGPFIGNRLQGIPYDEQPLSIRFKAKYNLALGDQAQFAAIFSLKGNTLAFANLTIEGTSKDTFGYFSIPITWSLSTNPDSVAIIVSSLNLESQEFNGDGYIIFDDIHFATISTRNKEIPNGDFENWSEETRPDLLNWYTTDDYLLDLVGFKNPFPLVKQSNKGRSGSKGLELTTKKLGDDLLPGMIISGESFVDVDRPTIPMNHRWTYLEGYYQYKPVAGDSAFIAAVFFKTGIPVGSVEVTIDKEATSYTYFAEEISFYSSIEPDSVVVFITSSNADNPQGDGSWLMIDDIRFTDQISNVFDLNLNRLYVYPNPFTSTIHLDGIDQIIGSDYSITDVAGKPIKAGKLSRSLTIDLNDEAAGVYVLHITGKHVNTSKILIKE